MIQFNNPKGGSETEPLKHVTRHDALPRRPRELEFQAGFRSRSFEPDKYLDVCGQSVNRWDRLKTQNVIFKTSFMLTVAK